MGVVLVEAQMTLIADLKGETAIADRMDLDGVIATTIDQADRNIETESTELNPVRNVVPVVLVPITALVPLVALPIVVHQPEVSDDHHSANMALVAVSNSDAVDLAHEGLGLVRNSDMVARVADLDRISLVRISLVPALSGSAGSVLHSCRRAVMKFIAHNSTVRSFTAHGFIALVEILRWDRLRSTRLSRQSECLNHWMRTKMA